MTQNLKKERTSARKSPRNGSALSAAKPPRAASGGRSDAPKARPVKNEFGVDKPKRTGAKPARSAAAKPSRMAEGAERSRADRPARSEFGSDKPARNSASRADRPARGESRSDKPARVGEQPERIRVAKSARGADPLKSTRPSRPAKPSTRSR